MNQALEYLYTIYSGFINMLFNDFEMFPNVTIGWVVVAVVILGLLINSVLNIPKGVRLNGKSDSYKH